MNERGNGALKVHTGSRVRLGRGDGRSQPPKQTHLDDVAREGMVAGHMPLVHSLCRRFVRSGEPLEDLVQVGSIGLLKAIRKFEPQRGYRFITYAVPVIVGEIKNHLRDHGWAVKVPRKVQRNKLVVQRAVDDLGQAMGRAPIIPEIAEATGLTDEQVYDTFEVGNYGRPFSLNADLNGNGSEDVSCLLEYLGSEDPGFHNLSDRVDLANPRDTLNKREKTIIHLKFYVGLSQAETAKRLGISQMHVSRLQRNALSKLRRHLTI